jgi:hypothetical protein
MGVHDVTELNGHVLAPRYVLAHQALTAEEKAASLVRDVALGVLHCGLHLGCRSGFSAGQQSPTKVLMDPE